MKKIIISLMLLPVLFVHANEPQQVQTIQPSINQTEETKNLPLNHVVSHVTAGIVNGSIAGVGNALFEKNYRNSQVSLLSWLGFWVERNVGDVLAFHVLQSIWPHETLEQKKRALDIQVLTSLLTSWVTYGLSKIYLNPTLLI